MSANRKYDLPDPRPHEIWQTSTGVAILLGLCLATVGVAAIIGYILGQIILWVLGL